MIDSLLKAPLPERDVQQAREVYQNMDGIHCVWTDRSIRQFDVDHVIPFSYWGNNDLWNLLPVAPRVNNQKRDKLPTYDLVQRRKELIIYYWSDMKDVHEERFIFETEKLMGKSLYEPGNWENRLFSSFIEAVEVTALQRGCERWEPNLY